MTQLDDNTTVMVEIISPSIVSTDTMSHPLAD